MNVVTLEYFNKDRFEGYAWVNGVPVRIESNCYGHEQYYEMTVKHNGDPITFTNSHLGTLLEVIANDTRRLTG